MLPRGRPSRCNRVVHAQGGTPPGHQRDTELVNPQWTHVGRLWTNGGPFLAIDATLRDAWLGFSQDQYSRVVGLGPQDASITVGTGRAAVVGADAVVRDDSWMEIFEAADGQVAIVQAAGPDYPDALARALEYPNADDEDGGTLNVPSGELAIFDAAADGAGPYSMPLLTAWPGTVPPVHGPPSDKADTGLLFPSARYYSPGLLLTGWAVVGAHGAGLTEGNGHLTIMVCETSEQRGGRRGHRR